MEFQDQDPSNPGQPPPGSPPPAAPRKTGPITDPNDPRLSDPAYGNDPDVLNYLNTIYGPGGTAFTPPTGTPGWNPQTQNWIATPPDPGVPKPPPPTPNPGTGNLIQPFNQPYAPAGSASPNPTPMPTIGGSIGTIPGAPQFPDIPAFKQPTIEEAMNDPGYQFTLQQGDKNLENWAAAKGTLNDSSTAKALIDYGQGAATTNYGNVWQRNFDTYNANVGTQYLDPFQANFQNWMTGTVNPTMAQYQTNAANVSHLNDVRWQDNWNQALQNWNIFRDQRDSTFNKQFQVATA